MTILITLRCNARCLECNQYIDNRDWGDSWDLDMEDIRRFIHECSHHRIEHIWISGGEPTLHPQLLSIWNAIKCANISKELRLNSNGVIKAPEGIDSVEVVRPADKKHVPFYFPAGDRTGWCVSPAMCGFAFDKSGWFACASGATIARIHGVKGARSINEIESPRKWCWFCGLAGQSQFNPE